MNEANVVIPAKAGIQGNDLPEGWQLVELGKICTVDNGRGFKKTEWVSDGIPIIRIQNLKNSEAPFNYFCGDLGEQHKVKAGDLLFAWSGTPGTSFGAHIWHGPDAALNQHIFNVRFDSKNIDPKYFYYALNQNVTRYVEQAQGGVGLAHITKGKFMSSTIPLMAIDQQKRIVAKIEELFSHIDAGIEALKKAKQLLKQYRQSVFKAAVTGELTKEWREANKDDARGSTNVARGRTPGATKLEPAALLLERILKERRQKWEEQQLEQFKAKGKMPKDDKWKEKYKELSPVTEEEVESLPKLPVGWIYTRLGNVIDEPKYGTSKKCSYDASGIGVLRIPNVAHGVIDSEDLKYAKFDDAEVETYKLNEGDILTIRSNGSINLVGKCALIDANDTKYLYAGYLIRLRPNSEVVAGSYLINAFNSMQLRQQIESKAKSTSGVNNINSGELQSLVIPMCSKEEQTISLKLVDEKLSSSDRLLKELNIQQIKAEKNKQSILATAFNGRLQ